MTGADIEAPTQPRRRLWAYLPVLVFAALVLAFFFALRSGDPSEIPSELIKKSAPEFSLPPLEGLRARDGGPVPGFATTDLAIGEVTVVNVWASWCAPCRAEHPLLMELAEKDGVRIAGINQKDLAENARRFLGALGNPFAVVGVDARGRASIDWGVYGVPETFIVDGEGVVQFKHIGPIDAAALDKAIRPAIAAAAER